MRIGLDFDNTIVDYAPAFEVMASKVEGFPVASSPTKTAIRDYLRSERREHEWTELQGQIYGPGMDHARPYPFVTQTIQHLKSAGCDVVIISHRTKIPYAGYPHDLHAAAHRWLEANELAGKTGYPLASQEVFYEQTKAAKFARIAQQQCAWFVDDLPEFLGAPEFPDNVHRILFDPTNEKRAPLSVRTARSWPEISAMICRSA